MKPLSVHQAACRLGIHPRTMRLWADQGKIPCCRINERGDRRFEVADVDALARKRGAEPSSQRIALYVRVSGRGDQSSSLLAQECELREALPGGREIVTVFSDVGSGLNERRRGLARALAAAKGGRFDELHITHPDRLTRFGEGTLRELFASYGVSLHILHETDDGVPEQELMADFMALITSFSGRLYGQRSAAARRRLLQRAKVRG